jgi:GTPase
MKFIDEAKIFVQSGDGGRGCMSFRREKFVPLGGPDGGDGGRGGSVIFVADSHKNTLLDLSYRPHLRAKRGEHGRGSNMHGKGADDLVVHVPPGVVIYDANTGEELVDLIEPGVQWVAAKGGDGGRGNARFMTNADKGPTRHDPGYPGEERWLRLVLKSLADVGLLGFPSAGKSTLISVISAARPKIASYPFTTLQPNLGTVDFDVDRRFVVADIPGIVEGAHEGVGLGLRFLRHIERTRLLVHLLDLDPLTDRDPLEDFDKLNNELASFDPKLGEKPQIIAANKTDVEGAAERLAELQAELAERGLKVLSLSAKEGIGVAELLTALEAKLTELDVAEKEATEETE